MIMPSKCSLPEEQTMVVNYICKWRYYKTSRNYKACIQKRR